MVGSCSFHEDRDRQVGRELRSTSSQAVLSHTSPALDSPARPRRPIDRPHGRSRLQADSPSNSSTSRGWSDLRKAWRCLPASPGPSSAACGRLARALLRCGMHLHCCLFAREKRDLERSQGRMLALSAHARSCISLYPVCVSRLTKVVPCSLNDSDDSKTKRNFCEACGVRRLQVSNPCFRQLVRRKQTLGPPCLPHAMNRGRSSGAAPPLSRALLFAMSLLPQIDG